SYAATELPPGVYNVTTINPDLMTSPTSVTVTAGGTATLNLTAAPRATVSGHVTNASSGAPLPNVGVYAANADGVQVFTVTDAAGQYQLAGLDAGTYSIVVGNDGDTGVAQANVTVGPSQTTVTRDFLLGITAMVTGTVFDADGVTPLANAT